MAAEPHAITALQHHGWKRSTNLGVTWTETAFPENFTPTTGAELIDGTLLVAGFTSTNSIPTSYRKPPGGTWQQTSIPETQPDGSVSTLDPRLVAHFDGKLYAHSHQKLLVSTDAITWQKFTLPDDPHISERVVDIHRFANSLALKLSTPSYTFEYLILQPGGGYHLLPAKPSSTLLNLDDEFPPHSLDGWPSFELKSSSDGVISGVRKPGHAVQGVTVSNLLEWRLSFSHYARTGDHWVLGYRDGTIWVGTDLSQAPVISQEFLPVKFHTEAGEFFADQYHSSDGKHWAPVARRTGRIISSTRDTFLLRHPTSSLLDHSSPDRTMTFSTLLHPMAGLDTIEELASPKFWPGIDSVLMTEFKSTTGLPNRTVQLIRPGPGPATVQPTNLGIPWERIHNATQTPQYWYVGGSRGSWDYPTFLARSKDGQTWQEMNHMKGHRVWSAGDSFLSTRRSVLGFSSRDGGLWAPHLLLGLPGAPDQIFSFRNHLIARVGTRIYVSPDGGEWYRSATRYRIESLHATEHDIIAVSTEGARLFPDVPHSAGPWLKLPAGHSNLEVPRHQKTTLEVDAGDEDGDLVGVDCFVDGVLRTTISSPPFRFPIDTSRSGKFAIEFVARDSAGRKARTTAVLGVTAIGVTQAQPVQIDPIIPRFLFKGKLYARNFLTSDDGVHWTAINPVGMNTGTLIANDRAIIAYKEGAIAVSSDGVTWITLKGLQLSTPSFTISLERENTFVLTEAGARLESEDGLNWRPAMRLALLPSITWLDANHGLGMTQTAFVATKDGGKSWFSFPGPAAINGTSIIAIADGFFVLGRDPQSPSISGAYFLRRGERAFTLIHPFPENENATFSTAVGGRALFGYGKTALFSTADGESVESHIPPPLMWKVAYFRFGGDWLGLAKDGFYASPDLSTWRKIFDTEHPDPYNESRDGITPTIIPHGQGSIIVVTTPSIPKGFIITPDLEVSAATFTSSGWNPSPNMSVDAALGGVRFKNRTVAIGGSFIFSKPDAAPNGWIIPQLLRGETFEPILPHPWPARFHDYPTRETFAATNDCFVMLVKPFNRAQRNDAVIRSADGITFHVHPWNAPVTLEKVTTVSASADTFLAATSDGRVLKSHDGLRWTTHQVSVSNFEIRQLLHFGGRWHALGLHPLHQVNGTWVMQWLEIWTSEDGENWESSFKLENSVSGYISQLSAPVTAHGKAWIKFKYQEWLACEDGRTWRIQTAHKNSPSTMGFLPLGEHPEGLLAIHPSAQGYLYIIDPNTWQIRRSIYLGPTELHRIQGWPYVLRNSTLTEWTEADPRLISITGTASSAAPGALLEIRLTAADLPAGVEIHFALSDDAFPGSPADVAIGSADWSSGVDQPDGGRRFTLAIPAGLAPGSYRVTAALRGDWIHDLALQNNVIGSESPTFEVLPAATTALLAAPLSPEDLNLRVDRKSDHLVVRYQRPAGLAPDELPTAEISSDLQEWRAELPAGASVRVIESTMDVEVVEIIIPYTAGRACFLRLRMSR